MELKTGVHGGNVYRARDRLNRPIDQILDYSANINPLGIPQMYKDAVVRHLDMLQYYPDPEYTDARRSLAKYHHVNASNIIMGNGATELLFLIMEALKPKKVLIPSPSFAEYRCAAESVGSVVVDYKLEEEKDFKLDVDDFFECITEDINMVVLCNPNNPTSQIIDRDDMEQIVQRCCDKGITVVVDEAFIEFVVEKPRLSMIESLQAYPNLFIVRAFTKFYAIPGLRLGYGVGNEKLIDRLWRHKQPWTLNNLADLAAQVLHRDEGYRQRSLEWLLGEKERFYIQLSDIEGIKVYKPYGNFILIRFLGQSLNSKLACEKMQQEGILVRDASNFNHLNGQYIRIAIKDAVSNELFLKVFKRIMKGVEARDELSARS